MKRILAILLAVMLVFSLAACGGNGDTPGNTDKPGTSQGGENTPGGNTDKPGNTDTPGGNTDTPGNQEGQIVTGGEVGAAPPTEIVLPENVKMVVMSNGQNYRTTIKIGNDYYNKDEYGDETFWQYIEADNQWQLFQMSGGAWVEGVFCLDVQEIYAKCFTTFKSFDRPGWSALTTTGRSQTIAGVAVKEYTYNMWEDAMFVWLSEDGIAFENDDLFLTSEWNISVTSFGFDTP